MVQPIQDYLPGLPISYARITADTRVARGPLLFFGLIMTTNSGSDSVDVYDGNNSSGRRVMRVAHSYQDFSPADRPSTLPVFLPAPILLDRGLFVDIANGVTEVTLFYLPVREEQLHGRVEGVVEGASE